jgi:uncharacterized phage protein (TIGR02218 family)
LDLGPYTATGTVTSVASKQEFTETPRAEPPDYYGEGLITFTSGLNAGLSQKIKTFLTGTFVLSLPMIQAIGVGDTYIVIAGCRKRATEDCAAKFDNILNFQGEPHLPGIDALTKSVV